MKIGLPFVALAGAAALALGAGAAQAHMGKSQALEAQMRAVEAAAPWYPAGAHYFTQQYQTLARQFRAVTGPGWRGGSCKRMFDGRERCVEIGPRDELVVRWSGPR